MFLDIIKIAGMIASTLTGVTALTLMIVRPFRERLLASSKDRKKLQDDTERARETDRCLLRNEIVSIYYKHYEERVIKQYAYENLALLYSQYKKLSGNSFVDKVWTEATKWKVVKN